MHSTLEVGEGYRYGQVFAPPEEEFVCLEPMAATVNALLAGTYPVARPGAPYAARLEIDYPERLSHWLPLVKWLLAIPHLILVALFVGGWGWGWDWVNDDIWGLGFAGLVGILVIIAGVVLLFTGSYPRSLFDFTLGLDRWVFRVAAYVTLMRDEYPPFRLDMGTAEPTEPERPDNRPDAGPPAP